MTKRTAAGSGASGPKLPFSGTKKPKPPPKNPTPGSYQDRTPTSNGQSHSTNPENRSSNQGRGGRRYGAYGGYAGVPYRKARHLASAEIRDQIRTLKPEIGSANRLYQRSLGDINYVFGETGDYINHQNALVAAQTQQAQMASQALAQQLTAQLTANGNTAQGGANDELARLGISGQGAGMPAYFSADQANAQNVGALMGADAQANVAAMGQGAGQIGALLGGANAAGRAGATGQALSSRAETIAKVQDAIRMAKQGRKDLTLQILQQLADSGWAQYMDQQQLNMQRAAMHGGGGGGGYSSTGQGSSGSAYGSPANNSTTYGANVNAAINALTGGGGPSKSKGKKGKPITPTGDDHRPYNPASTPLLSGFTY